MKVNVSFTNDQRTSSLKLAFSVVHSADVPIAVAPKTNGDAPEHATNGTSELEKNEAENKDGVPEEGVFQLTVKLPHAPYSTLVMCSTREYAPCVPTCRWPL